MEMSFRPMESETEENKLVTVDNPFQGCTIVVTGKLMTFIFMCVTGILITAMHMWVHIKNHFCRKGNWRMDSFVTNGF